MRRRNRPRHEAALSSRPEPPAFPHLAFLRGQPGLGAGNRRSQLIDEEIDLRLGDDERGRHAYRIADRAYQQPLFAREIAATASDAERFGKGLVRLRIAHQLDSRHQAGRADITDDRRGAQLLEPPREPLAHAA